MMAKAVFFDLDGTLVDSNEFHILAWAEAIEACGLRASRASLRNEIGKGADMLIPALFPGLGGVQRDLLEKTQGKIFETGYLPQVRPFPGASALVTQLRAQGIKVLLVSSSSNKEVLHYSKLLEIESHLDGAVSSDDAPHSKPAPDLFTRALEIVAPVQVHDVIAVGDTPYDVQAAAKCGIRTIALRSGGFSDRDLCHALAIYTDVQELMDQPFPFELSSH
jgi:HAD superfamily hydrolase (TIGR01509 family)